MSETAFEWAARNYPPGLTPHKRKIIKCSDPKHWYANKVGETMMIHYFVTFGAYTTDKKWIYYWDLSAPIK